jgi:hydrogenase nickel incorporation protein HypA/HybF
MHEEVLLRDLRRKLEEVAAGHPAHRITRVAIEVGALSHVTERALRARWSETTGGTAAEGSRLEVRSLSDPHDPRAAELRLVEVDVASEPRGPSPRARGPAPPPDPPGRAGTGSPGRER